MNRGAVSSVSITGSLVVRIKKNKVGDCMHRKYKKWLNQAVHITRMNSQAKFGIVTGINNRFITLQYLHNERVVRILIDDIASIREFK